jgi:hypothetical protein
MTDCTGEIRAPLWFVPEGKDPLSICVRTPASLNGVGYKTPLGCVDEASQLIAFISKIHVLTDYIGS